MELKKVLVEKEPYEVFNADFAPVSLEERLMNCCGLGSTYICGQNAAYP